jgi:hypothetical protein
MCVQGFVKTSSKGIGCKLLSGGQLFLFYPPRMIAETPEQKLAREGLEIRKKNERTRNSEVV